MANYSGSQNTVNTTAFIEAQQYSTFILENFHDGALPEMFYRNVSDFGSGTTLNIKTIGDVTLQETSELTPLTYNPIDTGTVSLSITDYVGDAYSVSDVLRQDGAQIDQLLAARAAASTRALQEFHETRAFAVANAAQTAGNANEINSFAHRLIASGTNQTAELADIIKLKVAFDKANVPSSGRVLVIDPVVAAQFDVKFSGTYAVDRNPEFMKLLGEGFARDHQFVMNLFGFHIITSNRLPQGITETIGTASVTNGVACIAMCLADDQTKPLMYAERQAPSVETDRDMQARADLFQVTNRFGIGAQRVDSLAVLLVNPVLA